jgi:glycosyltransferase involved in cell wall biosynthesis
MPSVSICIPTYNGALYLAECIESALAQSFADIEILLVDDSSTDDSLAIAHNYALRDKRIRVFQNDVNLGLVANWNRSVTLAEGEWIKFLHQDDRLEPNCVERMLDAAQPNVDLIATRRRLMFASDVSEEIKRWYDRYLSEHDPARLFRAQAYVSPEEFTRVLLLEAQGNCLGEPTAIMLRRSAFDSYGYFNPDLVSLCDWEYWARIAVNTGLCYVDEPLAYFRVHSTSESARMRATGRFRLRLDPLIILYEMTYSPYYVRLRAIAGNQNPPVNLRQRLSDEVGATHWEAAAQNDGGKALAQWWQAMRRRPRLLAFSPRHILRVLRKKIGL